MFSSQEQAVLLLLRSDLPLSSRPFRIIARKAGLEEEQVIAIIKSLEERGVIRRMGVVLGHRTLGYAANALVLWAVPEERVPEIGRKMSSFIEITHCYHRRVPPGCPYNLFTMVHAPTRDLCMEKIRSIAGKTGLDDYQVLFSTVEFKKTGVLYDF